MQGGISTIYAKAATSTIQYSTLIRDGLVLKSHDHWHLARSKTVLGQLL